jgi:hypothetical protein
MNSLHKKVEIIIRLKDITAEDFKIATRQALKNIIYHQVGIQHCNHKNSSSDSKHFLVLVFGTSSLNCDNS